MSDLISTLEQQERDLVLDAFSHDDAWELGAIIHGMAQGAGSSVGIDIRRPGLRLFRAVTPGVAPDQDVWIDRKAAVVLRMEASSALVDARMKAGGVDPVAIGWLDHRYAITGGSFPIRVRGAGVVAVATASGLSSMEDHDLVVEGVRTFLEQQR